MTIPAPPEGTTPVGPTVAYSFGNEKYPHDGLLIWHWCDHHNWAGRSGYDREPEEYLRWVPTGVGAHTLVSKDPLHIEPSINWPDCCGLHGFIRDGLWVGV